MSDERALALRVEYDGTDYAGWQRQLNAPTVQQHLEEALAVMCGHPVILRGSGRTDSGVHSRGQVAAFSTTCAIPPLGVMRGLNTALPRSIGITAVAEVPLDFDARRHAAGKHYRYQIWNREARSPLADRTCWHVSHPRLDAAAMHAAAQVLVGEHDFSAFRAADCDRVNPVRTIRRLEVHRDGDMLIIEVHGTAFLKHMVRIIAGTLEEVGRGRRSEAELRALLAGGDRQRGGRTAPPKGLTLMAVAHTLAIPWIS